MIATILWWGIVWTLLSTGIIAVTCFVCRRIGNAATRHLAWVATFSSTWLVPAYAAVSASARPSALAPCIAVSPAPLTAQRLVAGAVVLLWLSGILFAVTRAILARRAMKRWRANSRDCRQIIQRLSPPVSFPNDIELRVVLQGQPSVPITWGARNPVVLLPAQALEWESSRLTAVLLHEVAHVRRLDNLTHLFALLTCACHWFNPAFRLAARRMEMESEMAADDIAILHGMKPSSYAQELISLASKLSSSPAACELAQTAMVKPSTLERRLLRIIDPMGERKPICLFSLVVPVTILLSAFVTIACVTPKVNASLQPKEAAKPGCLGAAN